jgi:hypothetical protein
MQTGALWPWDLNIFIWHPREWRLHVAKLDSLAEFTAALSRPE